MVVLLVDSGLETNVPIACVSSIDRLVEKADMAKNSCWEHSEGKEGKRLHSFKESKLIKYSQ
jgi:hypothetical protein